MVKIFVGLLGAALIGFYLYSQTNLFIRGPEVTFIDPVDGASFSDPFITVRGTTLNASRITLNGAPISVDTEGYFEESLLLAPGSSILEVAVEDRFGRKTTKTLTLFYKEPLDTTYGKERTATSTNDQVLE